MYNPHFVRNVHFLFLYLFDDVIINVKILENILSVSMGCFIFLLYFSLSSSFAFQSSDLPIALFHTTGLSSVKNYSDRASFHSKMELFNKLVSHLEEMKHPQVNTRCHRITNIHIAIHSSILKGCLPIVIF